MSDIDYQLIADQINFNLGYSYTADDVRAMIDSITREPVKPVEFGGLITYQGMGMGKFKFFGTQEFYPDRIYRKNPHMTPVAILQKAVTNAGYGIVHHRALLRKEKPNVDR